LVFFFFFFFLGVGVGCWGKDWPYKKESTTYLNYSFAKLDH